MNKKYILLLALINLILQIYAYNYNSSGISYLLYPYLLIFLLTVYLCFLKSSRKYTIITLILLILIDVVPPLCNANIFSSHKVLRGDTLTKIN